MTTILNRKKQNKQKTNQNKQKQPKNNFIWIVHINIILQCELRVIETPTQ